MTTTQCVNCGRTLTSYEGKRLESANFDSNLPCFPPTDNKRLGTSITWARCDRCYEAAWPTVLDAQTMEGRK